MQAAVGEVSMLSQKAVALIILGTRLYYRLASLERARGARERARALARFGCAAACIAFETGASSAQIQELASVLAGVAGEAE